MIKCYQLNLEVSRSLKLDHRRTFWVYVVLTTIKNLLMCVSQPSGWREVCCVTLEPQLVWLLSSVWLSWWASTCRCSMAVIGPTGPLWTGQSSMRYLLAALDFQNVTRAQSVFLVYTVCRTGSVNPFWEWTCWLRYQVIFSLISTCITKQTRFCHFVRAMKAFCAHGH